MDKENIVSYVMNSPQNSNPAILRSLLNQLDGNNSGGLLVTVTFDSPSGAEVADKTYGEIFDVISNGGSVVIKHKMNAQSGEMKYSPIALFRTFEYGGEISYRMKVENANFEGGSANDYPKYYYD